MSQPVDPSPARRTPNPGPPPPPVSAPPSQARHWFVAVGGRQAGPFTYGELASMARAGQISPVTLAWRQGMDNWAALNTIPEMALLFSGGPAPEPPRRLHPLVVAAVAIAAIAGFWWWRNHAGGASSTPDKAFVQMVRAVAENRPVALWDSLPPSYQKDVAGLVSAFAGTMDKDIWDKGVSVVRKGTGLLKARKTLLAQAAKKENPKVDEKMILAACGATADVGEILLKSDLASLDRLKSIDIRGFLDIEGARMMARIAAADTEFDPKDYEAFRAMCRSAEARTVSRQGDSARIEFSFTGYRPREMDFVRVEERWIPKEMAEGWTLAVAQAYKGIAAMPKDMVRHKSEILVNFAMLEGSIAAMESLTDEKQLSAFIQESPLENVFDGIRSEVEGAPWSPGEGGLFSSLFDAQNRADVARAKSDMRSMATALESYYVDNNDYPACTSDPALKAFGDKAGQAKELRNVPTFALCRPGARMMTLTAPMAYVTGFVPDPFSPAGSATFGYYTDAKHIGWILWSPGPDGTYDLNMDNIAQLYVPHISQPSTTLIAGTNAAGRAFTYDPTNGAASVGDIYLVNQ
ncbi:MAG: GYF domain-containing protein [Candidatus Sumerlaeota bacterium]|nr:GYF domain-containing protein [Candidatus Sumerlaeota bacterium]